MLRTSFVNTVGVSADQLCATGCLLFTFEGLRSSSNVLHDAWIETAAYRSLVRSARPNGITASVFGAEGIEPRIIETLTSTCTLANIGAADCQAVTGGLDIGSPLGALNQYVPFSEFKGGGFDGIPDIQFVRLPRPAHFAANNSILELTTTLRATIT